MPQLRTLHLQLILLNEEGLTSSTIALLPLSQAINIMSAKPHIREDVDDGEDLSCSRKLELISLDR